MFDNSAETFVQAASAWNLEQLYTDLSKAKAKAQKSYSNLKTRGLTDTEKLHLRGLLCGHSPATIANKLGKQSTQGTQVEFSKTIYCYVKELTRHTQDSIDNWRIVVQWLANAGYQRQKIDIMPESPQIDWGNAPAATNFYGRREELTTLKKWIGEDRCQLVSLLGMGGIGKTALAVELVEKIYPEFDRVVWRSLFPRPKCQNTLVPIFPNIDRHVSALLDYLRAHRCLIILDSFETILNDNPIGSYRQGFEIYGELLQRIGNERHQSCGLVISREQPQDFRLNDPHSPIRTLRLSELQEAAQILLERKLQDVGENWRILVKTYGGNPFALQLVANLIQDLFGGRVREFLQQNTTFFDPELRSILTQQFDRLSDLEQELLQKLASEAQPLSLCQLLPIIPSIVSKSELMNVLQSLQHRSLIEQQFVQGDIQYTLPQLVMKFAQKLR
jgi:hypothetical protein